MSENTTYQQQNLFAEASLARMLASPATDLDSKENVQRSGVSSLELFAKFVPDGSLLKTSQGYFQVTMEGSLEKFSESFPKSGMMRSGELFQLVNSDCSTCENESLLLPTPVRTLDRGYSVGTAKRLEQGIKSRPSGAKIGVSLNWFPPLLNFFFVGKKNLVNPRLLEWLMGFPISWTELEQTETP